MSHVTTGSRTFDAVRVTSAKELNDAVHAPGVKEFVVPPQFERLDMSSFVDDPDNVVLRCGDGVLMFRRMWGFVFEAHYLFPPSVRGAAAVSAAKKMLETMFTTYRASAIHGYTPRENRAARVMNRRLGLTPSGAVPNLNEPDTVHYVLERKTWEHSLKSARASLV